MFQSLLFVWFGFSVLFSELPPCNFSERCLLALFLSNFSLSVFVVVSLPLFSCSVSSLCLFLCFLSIFLVSSLSLSLSLYLSSCVFCPSLSLQLSPCGIASPQKILDLLTSKAAQGQMAASGNIFGVQRDLDKELRQHIPLLTPLVKISLYPQMLTPKAGLCNWIAEVTPKWDQKRRTRRAKLKSG